MPRPKRPFDAVDVDDVKKVKSVEPSYSYKVVEREPEDNSEDVDDPVVKSPRVAAVSSPKLQYSITTTNTASRAPASLLSGPPDNEFVSVVSVPMPCMLCNDKSGAKLRLGQNNIEVTEHYKLCLYNLGILQEIVEPGPENTTEDGQVLDTFGKRFQYKCLVRDCEKSKRTAKSMSYKEFVFHCYQFHGVMKRSLTAAQKLAKAADKEKYERLITTVCDVPGRNLGDPEFRIDEIHDCLLCNGVFKETNKENKEAKGMRLNLCVTRNHYALCMHDDEEGLAFYKKMYPLPEERPDTIHQFKCQEEECLKDKRFRQGVNYKQFASHNALYHGGLDMFLEQHPRQEMRDMVDKLRCSKVPDRCYVPDHYGC